MKKYVAIMTILILNFVNIGTAVIIQDENTGGPDLVITELIPYYSEELKQLTFRYIVKNVGGTYVDPNGEEIGFVAEFYVDSSTTPSDSLILPRIWLPNQDPTVLEQGWSEGWGWVLELDEKPTTLTMKVDTTNVIPESNEENNEKTAEVFLDISISGTVYKKIDDTLVPVPDMQLSSEPFFNSRSSFTDENGEYILTVIPKEPFDECHTYEVRCCHSILEPPFLMKTSNPVRIGESTVLNFIITSPPDKPAKPTGDQTITINTTHTYTTSSTDPDGDQLYYLFDWGDGTDRGWIGPYDSGETVSASHSWSETGFYKIIVTVKDAEGLINEVASDPLTITISKGKSSQKVITTLLTRLFNIFQWLEQLLNRFPFFEKIF